MRPRPITKFEAMKATKLPSASYSALPAIAPTSWKESLSSSCSMRSRTVSLPPSRWRLILSGPPLRRAISSRRRSSSTSFCQLMRSSFEGNADHRLEFGDRNVGIANLDRAHAHGARRLQIDAEIVEIDAVLRLDAKKVAGMAIDARIGLAPAQPA